MVNEKVNPLEIIEIELDHINNAFKELVVLYQNDIITGYEKDLIKVRDNIEVVRFLINSATADYFAKLKGV